ncbi:TetR family transcriptional regulator [Nocardia sp. NPDC058176]|uniref:TetR/AcrR family transcriptional regulator n=1 Tax=Nocardia sp. NPDC058176 TaxID=3346368 RepID=UPI0036D973BA
MYSPSQTPATPTADLTTAARIREAAIDLFGEQGFGVGVRAIATAAGVSPGLVNHHFGSKDGLRAACDARVLEIIRDEKLRAVSTPGPGAMLASVADIERYAPVAAYLMRSFQAGGALAEALVEHMVADAIEYQQVGVESGHLRPSRDPAARARYLVLCHIGAMNLALQLRRQREGELDYRAAMRDFADEMLMPAFELYTYGLLTDSTLYDTLTEE